MFVRGSPIQLHHLRRTPSPTQSSTASFAIVLLFVVRSVFIKSILTFVITAHAQSHIFSGMQISGERSLAQHTPTALPSSANASTHISSVMRNRVGSEYAQQTSHSVTTIERTLWTTQHIHAFNALKRKVVGRLIGIGHIVYIQTYGRRIDATTNTTDVTSRGESAAIVGHKKVGGISRKSFHIFHITLFKGSSIKKRHTKWLFA